MRLKIKEGWKESKTKKPHDVSLYKTVPQIVAGLSCCTGGPHCPEHFPSARRDTVSRKSDRTINLHLFSCKIKKIRIIMKMKHSGVVRETLRRSKWGASCPCAYSMLWHNQMMKLFLEASCALGWMLFLTPLTTAYWFYSQPRDRPKQSQTRLRSRGIATIDLSCSTQSVAILRSKTSRYLHPPLISLSLSLSSSIPLSIFSLP